MVFLLYTKSTVRWVAAPVLFIILFDLFTFSAIRFGNTLLQLL